MAQVHPYQKPNLPNKGERGDRFTGDIGDIPDRSNWKMAKDLEKLSNEELLARKKELLAEKESFRVKYAPEIGGTVGAIGGLLMGGPPGAIVGAIGGAGAGALAQEAHRREFAPELAAGDAVGTAQRVLPEMAFAGLGEIAGQGVNLAVRKGGGAIKGAFTPAEGAKEAQELLQRYGGSLTVGQATEHDAAELIAREAWFGRGIFAKRAKENQLAIVKAKNDILADLTDTPQGEIVMKSGQGLQAALDAADAKFKDLGRRAYAEVDVALKEAARPRLIQSGRMRPRTDVVDMRPIKEYSQRLVEAYEARGSKPPAALTDFMNTPDRLTFAQAQAKRTDMLELMRGAERSTTEQAPTLKRYYSELQDKIERQMEVGARKTGKPEIYDAYRKASEFWREGKELLGDEVIAGLVKANPEDVAGQLFRSGNVSEIKKVKSVLDKYAKWDPTFSADYWKQMQAAWLTKQFETRGAIDVSKKELRGSYLSKLLETGQDRRTFEAVFEPAERARVSNFFRTVELSQNLDSKGLVHVGVPIIQAGALGTVLYFPQQDESKLAGAAAILIGPRVLAKALTNPKMVNYLTGAVGKGLKFADPIAQKTFVQELTDLGGKMVTATRKGASLVLQETVPTGARVAAPMVVDVYGENNGD